MVRSFQPVSTTRGPFRWLDKDAAGNYLPQLTTSAAAGCQ
jgi:hypothetical protein